MRGAAYKSAKEDILALGWSDTLISAVAAPLTGVDEAHIPSGGYVLDSLRASLWCIENTIGFQNAILLAVNLGDDADTTGAITGQIAGAMYGYSSIDTVLKMGLFGERRIYVTSQFLGRSFADSQ